MTFCPPLVDANEVVDEITFAPKRYAPKLRLGNQTAWVMRVCNPTVARPIGLALCRTRLPTGAGKTQVRTSSRRVERGLKE